MQPGAAVPVVSAPLDPKHIIGGDAKQFKFDRQLRLWGTAGQAALEASHVVVLGATPATTEALKSLILTGVRTVTLVDERVVSTEDVATNYFVAPSTVGRSLAETVLRHTCALGEQCVAVAAQVPVRTWVDQYTTAVEEDWAAEAEAADEEVGSAAFDENAHQQRGSFSPPCAETSAVLRFLATYPALCDVDLPASSVQPRATLVGSEPAQERVAATTLAPLTMPPPDLIIVSERMEDLSFASPLLRACNARLFPAVPVVLVRSSGLLGLVQTCSPYRVILRPENPNKVKMEDLRIFEPFPALQSWFDAHHPDDAALFPTDDLDAMMLHSHLPYPCILHHAYRRWWASLPRPEQQMLLLEKPSLFPLAAKHFKAIAGVAAGMTRRTSPPEEAFMEAMDRCTARLNRPVVTQRLPKGLEDLLADPRCSTPMLAAREVRLRRSASSRPTPTPEMRAAALWRIWMSPEVLIWFVLHAVHRFICREVKEGVRPALGEEEAAVQASMPRSAEETHQGGAAGTVPQQELFPPLPVKPTSAFHMPLSGYVPDFTTSTTWYRELQNLYHAEHMADVACIAKEAERLLSSALQRDGLEGDRDGNTLSHTVPEPVLTTYKKQVRPLLLELSTDLVANVWDVCGVRFGGFYAADSAGLEWRERLGRRLIQLTHDPESSADPSPARRRAICLVVAYLAKEEMQRRGAWQRDEGIPFPDAEELGHAIAEEVVALMEYARVARPPVEQAASAPPSGELIRGVDEREAGGCTVSASPEELPAPWWGEGATQALFRQVSKEVARWDGGTAGRRCVQLPSVAASTGALAAQESVKLLMRIRVPSGGLVLYDGYTNTVCTM